MNLEQIDTSTTAGKALAQFAELLKVGGCEGELRIGRAFGEALVAEIAALTPPEGYVPERSVLVAATRLRKLASAATPMARSAYVKAAELIELAVSAARPEVP